MTTITPATVMSSVDEELKKDNEMIKEGTTTVFSGFKNLMTNSYITPIITIIITLILAIIIIYARTFKAPVKIFGVLLVLLQTWCLYMSNSNKF